MTIKDKCLEIWQTLKPEQRKKLVFVAIGLGIVILSLMLYKATRSPGTAPRPSEGKRDVALDKGTLEKSLYNESTRQMGDIEAEMKAVKEQIAALQQGKKPEEGESAEPAKGDAKAAPGAAKPAPKDAKPAPKEEKKK